MRRAQSAARSLTATPRSWANRQSRPGRRALSVRRTDASCAMSASGDAELLDRVVSVTLEVPWRVERLGVRGCVRRPARQLMIADGRLPPERPRPPGELATGGTEGGVAPLPVDP